MIRSLVHNVLAHPILGITQALEELAERFHDLTAPEPDQQETT